MSNASHSPKISDLHGPVFDAIPDMFVLYDKDHTILDILHPKPELMSDRPEAFIGKSMTEERLKQVVGANYHQLEAVISTQNPVGSFSGTKDTGAARYFITKSIFPGWKPATCWPTSARYTKNPSR